MAGRASRVRRLAAVSHLLRLVYRMALGAGIEALCRIMRLMAHVAVWFEAMRGVALAARQLSMLARITSQLRLRPGMTGTTGVSQPLGHGHLLDGVRISVTVGTVGHGLAMRQIVRIHVTVEARREPLEECRRMRRRMAVGALWNSLVAVLVAGRTGNCGVLGRVV